MVIGAGFLVTIAIVVPMGFFNLEDNIGFQIVSTCVQTIILIEWVVTFFMRGFQTESVSAFGTGQGQGDFFYVAMVLFSKQ